MQERACGMNTRGRQAPWCQCGCCFGVTALFSAFISHCGASLYEKNLTKVAAYIWWHELMHLMSQCKIRVFNYPATTKEIALGYFYHLCSVPLRPVENCIFFASHRTELLLFSLPQALMKLNQNVTENKPKNVTTWLSMLLIIRQMGQGVPLVVMVVLQCCLMFTGARRTVRMSLWVTAEGKTMITYTESTCPACTAVAAATAVRPPSLLQPTPSAMHLSLNTCKYYKLWLWRGIYTKWKAKVADNLSLQLSQSCAPCGWY